MIWFIRLPALLIMAGLLSIPSGLLSDRIGRRPLLLVGLSLLAGSSFLLAASQSPLQMGCIYLAFGVGLAALTPTLMSYVADIAPPETLGRAFGWYTMSLYSGMTLGMAACRAAMRLLDEGWVLMNSGGAPPPALLIFCHRLIAAFGS